MRDAAGAFRGTNGPGGAPASAASPAHSPPDYQPRQGEVLRARDAHHLCGARHVVHLQHDTLLVHLLLGPQRGARLLDDLAVGKQQQSGEKINN